MRRVGLVHTHERDPPALEVGGDEGEVQLVARGQDDHERARIVRSEHALARGVDDLRGLLAARQIGSDYDVVTDRVDRIDGLRRDSARRSADVTVVA